MNFYAEPLTVFEVKRWDEILRFCSFASLRTALRMTKYTKSVDTIKVRGRERHLLLVIGHL